MPASSRSKPRSGSRSTPQGVRPTPGEAVKVVADVTPEMERCAGLSSERFCATRTEDGRLRIDNVPWAATDLAFDVVAGEFLGTTVTQDREVPVHGMTRVVRPSGWRTLVAVHEPPFSVDRWSAAKKEIRALGAETLHARRHSMAVGVPPDATLSPILDVLRLEELQGRFDWLVLAGG